MEATGKDTALRIKAFLENTRFITQEGVSYWFQEDGFVTKYEANAKNGGTQLAYNIVNEVTDYYLLMEGKAIKFVESYEVFASQFEQKAPMVLKLVDKDRNELTWTQVMP